MLDGGGRRSFVSGPQGPKGDTGDKGDTGLTGAPGPAPWAPIAAWAPGLICVASAPATQVAFGGETYVCAASHLAGGSFALDLAAGRWIKVAAKGADGINGAQPWQSPPVPWVASTAYTATAPASCVTYQGGCYVCATAHTSGATFDAAKWTAIAQAAAGTLLAANNLSDVGSVRAALTNLGHAGSPVRQTVQAGPASAGAPAFLPATTSGTLTLAFQGVSGASPLVLTCAKGFDAAGAVDQIALFSANPSIALPASATSYLYYDFDAVAWWWSALPPIYQAGGAISSASGQFTFDYAAMVGWIGTGSGVQRANRLFAGEAVTSASAVTSTIAYAFNGTYDSGWTATLPAASTTTTRSHNLGVVPLVRRFVAQCTTADVGFAVGETVDNHTGLTSWISGAYPVPIVVAGARNTLRLAMASDSPEIVNPSSYALVTMTRASWQWKLVAQRGW